MTDSARTSRKDAIREIKRGIILDAAMRIFERDGLDGASMRAIGDAAGYTAAAIYFHFPNKEAIYGELLSQSLDRLIEAVDRSVDRQPGVPEKLEAAAMAVFDFYAENPRDLDLGFYLFRGGMRPRGLSAELNERLNDKLAASLQPIAAAARDIGAAPRRLPSITADVFAHAVGLLLMEHTGRIKLFGGQTRKLMLAHARRTVADLQECP
jgi:AcrR family transcriptional regulator